MADVAVAPREQRCEMCETCRWAMNRRKHTFIGKAFEATCFRMPQALRVDMEHWCGEYQWREGPMLRRHDPGNDYYEGEEEDGL